MLVFFSFKKYWLNSSKNIFPLFWNFLTWIITISRDFRFTRNLIFWKIPLFVLFLNTLESCTSCFFFIHWKPVQIAFPSGVSHCQENNTSHKIPSIAVKIKLIINCKIVLLTQHLFYLFKAFKNKKGIQSKFTSTTFEKAIIYCNLLLIYDENFFTKLKLRWIPSEIMGRGLQVKKYV